MSGPRFAHLTGRRMWERCDHSGTRIEGSPAAFAGAPIALITAGLLSLAFMGFAGLPVR